MPHTVVFDTSHHTPAPLPSPYGWAVMKRNGRVWIAEGDRNVTRMDAAQNGILTDLHSQEDQLSPSIQLLQLISASSRVQQQSDLEHRVHWSRHLLAHIRKVTQRYDIQPALPSLCLQIPSTQTENLVPQSPDPRYQHFSISIPLFPQGYDTFPRILDRTELTVS